MNPIPPVTERRRDVTHILQTDSPPGPSAGSYRPTLHAIPVAGLATAEDRMRAAYARHRDPVWRFFVRRVGHGELAEDLTSEVFLVAWRRHAAPDAAALELPWLYGVARRVLANDRRAAGRRAALAQRLAADAAVGDAAPDDLDRLVTNATYLAALAQLGELDREVLLLAGWEGLDPREIAVALDCRLSTARVRLHRARGRLARLLATGPTEGSTT